MDITTIKYPSHNDLVQWYYQLAKDIAESAEVTPEEVNELIAAYVEEHPYPVVPSDIITASNAAQNVVTSVNGKKGDVTVTGGGDVPDNVLTEDNIAQNAVTSFNGKVGAVTGVSSVNGQTGEVTVEEVPANVITTDNLGGLAVLSFNGQTGVVNYAPPVTSVNGRTGAVSVSESPANVITTDNIAGRAVTSFNGAVGAVTGVTSVNGQTGASVSLLTNIPGGVDINIGGGKVLRIANINLTYGLGGTSYYAGVFPKQGATNIDLLASATFMSDPAPFAPSYAGIDQSEGVWTVVIGGLSSGTAPAPGTTKTACVAAVVS